MVTYETGGKRQMADIKRRVARKGSGIQECFREVYMGNPGLVFGIEILR
jgi:hypothetical protein